MFGVFGIANAFNVTYISITDQNNSTFLSDNDTLVSWFGVNDITIGTKLGYAWIFYKNGNIFLRGINTNGTNYNFSSFEIDNDGWTENNFTRSTEWASEGIYSEKISLNHSQNATLFKTFNFTTNISFVLNISSAGTISGACAFICPAEVWEDCSLFIDNPSQAVRVYVGNELFATYSTVGLYNITIDLNKMKSGNVSIYAYSNEWTGYSDTELPCILNNYYSYITAYIDVINVTYGEGYTKTTDVLNLANISANNTSKGERWVFSAESCNELNNCSGNSYTNTSTYTIYDISYTNISTAFEGSTQTFLFSTDGISQQQPVQFALFNTENWLNYDYLASVWNLANQSSTLAVDNFDSRNGTFTNITWTNDTHDNQSLSSIRFGGTNSRVDFGGTDRKSVV
jgi:hypothetical protein